MKSVRAPPLGGQGAPGLAAGERQRQNNTAMAAAKPDITGVADLVDSA